MSGVDDFTRGSYEASYIPDTMYIFLNIDENRMLIHKSRMSL